MVWGPKFWWGALPYLDGVMVSGSQSLVGLVWLSHLDDVMDLGHQPLMTCVIPSWRCDGFGVSVVGDIGCPVRLMERVWGVGLRCHGLPHIWGTQSSMELDVPWSQCNRLLDSVRWIVVSFEGKSSKIL